MYAQNIPKSWSFFFLLSFLFFICPHPTPPPTGSWYWRAWSPDPCPILCWAVVPRRTFASFLATFQMTSLGQTPWGQTPAGDGYTRLVFRLDGLLQCWSLGCDGGTATSWLCDLAEFVFLQVLNITALEPCTPGVSQRASVPGNMRGAEASILAEQCYSHLIFMIGFHVKFF